MPAILPFRLKVPGRDEVKGLRAISTSYRFQGLLRLSEELLHIEWRGTAQVQDVGALGVRDDQLALPDEQLTVPVASLYRARVAGGWWRPRLELQARHLTLLSIVPSEEFGTVRFWYDRADRALAQTMARQLSEAIATALLRGPESLPQIHPGEDPVPTPPGGMTSR